MFQDGKPAGQPTCCISLCAGTLAQFANLTSSAYPLLSLKLLYFGIAGVIVGAGVAAAVLGGLVGLIVLRRRTAAKTALGASAKLRSLYGASVTGSLPTIACRSSTTRGQVKRLCQANAEMGGSGRIAGLLPFHAVLIQGDGCPTPAASSATHQVALDQ
jgi:hypothetical protein